MSYSNPEFAKLVNESMVSTWVNRIPNFRNKEKATEHRIKTESYDAYPTRNFCTFFLTPDLRVLTYLSGHYSPAYFIQEASFALSLAKVTTDESLNFREAENKEYAKLHLERCRQWRTQLADIELVGKPAKLSKEQSGKKEERAQNLRDGLRHLAEVHEDMADRAGNMKRVPLFCDVMKNHLFGNPFTEE